MSTEPPDPQTLLKRLTAPTPRADRYRILEEIGRGGMGRVLEVVDTDLDRPLAMKILGGQPGETERCPVDPGILSRFIAEAQVTGQLEHPGVVPVHDVGMDGDSRVYFTMRQVQGDDLGVIFRKVRSGADGWNETRAVGVIQKVCDTMAFAHHKGVVHRDLKPSNIMIGQYGEVYVMDWGLALVEGEGDPHDLRRRGVEPTAESAVRTDRTDVRASDSDSPLMTMDGAIVGTPYYMAPEQALGRADRLESSADVYAIGAMLYQLLAGAMPYDSPGCEETPRAVIRRIISGPPDSLRRAAPQAREPLRAICEQAMARRPEDRYASVVELGEDLRAYLEHRVVRAYRTGTLAEAVMWIRRNRALAAVLVVVILVLLGGGASTLMEKARADQEARSVLLLSGFRTLEELERRADELWPVHPELVPRLEEWLRDATAFVATLDRAEDNEPGLRAQLKSIRERISTRLSVADTAIPIADPRYPEIRSLRDELRALRRAQAIREGFRAPKSFEIDSSARALTIAELRVEAGRRIYAAPTEYGQEPEGLALARWAVQRVDVEMVDTIEAHIRERGACRFILAHALITNGLDSEVLELLEWFDAAATPAIRSAYRGWADDVRQKLAAARKGETRDVIDRLEEQIARLALECEPNLPLQLPSEEDRFLRQRMARLVQSIAEFSDSDTGLLDGVSLAHGVGVRKRLEMVVKLEEHTSTGAAAKARWAEAIASVRANPKYDGFELQPVFGLVPLGTDPDSGLMEFVHLSSGSEPERDAGRVVPGEGMGIVLVLIPGGRFTMGARATGPRGVGLDPDAKSAENLPHEVRCSAFLLSKYELTQAQWKRLTGSDPSQFRHREIYDAWNASGRQADATHPVEQISWHDGRRILRQAGLDLPNEAQWEYAARGGRTTRWWTGEDSESLAGRVNVADAFAAPWRQGWNCESFRDGELIHAPVGTLPANPFGLHEILGNVAEWCLDGLLDGFYRFSPLLDPVCPPWTSRSRVIRGGSYRHAATQARCSARDDRMPQTADNWIGLRPALVLGGGIGR